MIGYPLSLKIISKILKKSGLKKDYSYCPTVTVMVVAHNEEKVIKDKLENLMRLQYPKDKLEFLVSSDNSTDKTNDIVREFIKSHPNEKIRLFEVKKRKGKTNAQNEAQKTVTSEILVMTDANSILDEKSIIELEDAVKLIKNAELVISSRYHALVVALSVATPIVSVLRDVLGDKRYYYNKNLGMLIQALDGIDFDERGYLRLDYLETLKFVTERFEHIVNVQKNNFNHLYEKNKENIKLRRKSFLERNIKQFVS